MISFPFVLFCFFSPLCIHTYIYEFSCWVLIKAHRLVNKHDTKVSNELKEDHNINYSVGFGVWAQFRGKFLIQIAQLLILFLFFGTLAEEKTCELQFNVSSNSMLVSRIICFVSFLFFIWKLLFIYLSIVNVLCMSFDFVSYFVCKKCHE